MKKLAILVVFGLIVPAISLASIDINLKYGAIHIEVKELQEFLIEKGFLSGDATGNFFTLTRKAVVAYQGSVGLPATGYVGPMTREKINAELSIADTSSNTAEVTETGTITPPTNSKNETTIALQKQLDALLLHLQELVAQSKSQTTTQQQTQTTIQQIQQNTNPAPVTIVESPVPVEITTNGGVSLDKVGFFTYGGNCGGASFKVAVKYDNGKTRWGDSITMTIDGKSETSVVGSGYANYEFNKGNYVSSGDTMQMYAASYFGYKTTSTTETTIPVTFTSGNLSKTVSMTIKPLIIDKNDSSLKYENGKYVMTASGVDYNPDTYQCS